MKKLIVISLAAISLVASSCCSNGTANVEIKTSNDSLANAIGTIMSAQLKPMLTDEELNSAIIANAMSKVFQAEDIKDLEADITAADAYFRNYMSVVLPAKKIAAGAEFLAKTEKKANIQKTESGLLYEIIEVGDAENMPVAEDTVIANYRGALINGTEFDSSYSRNEPAEFPLNQVIPGWTEGLQLIGKGGKIKLYIPSELGYGANGNLANEVLVFDVELVDIKKAEVKKATDKK